MENRTIEIDKNGIKWIWINGAFYEYDERPIEEIEKDLSNYLKNNREDLFMIFRNIEKVLSKINISSTNDKKIWKK